jgi:hypothetical protein
VYVVVVLSLFAPCSIAAMNTSTLAGRGAVLINSSSCEAVISEMGETRLMGSPSYWSSSNVHPIKVWSAPLIYRLSGLWTLELPAAMEPLMDGRRMNAHTKSQLLLSSCPGLAMQNHQCCLFVVVGWWASPWFPSSMLITPCRWLLCCTLLLQVWYTSTCLHILNHALAIFFKNSTLVSSGSMQVISTYSNSSRVLRAHRWSSSFGV